MGVRQAGHRRAGPESWSGADLSARLRVLQHLALAGLLASLLGGCAMSIPLASMDKGGDVTGSISPRDGRFSNAMSDEDWSRARGALQSALDDTALSVAVPWSNPASGLKGTITRVAAAVPTDTGACQAFVATMVDAAQTQWYQGQACRTGTTWTVTSAAQWTPPPHQA